MASWTVTNEAVASMEQLASQIEETLSRLDTAYGALAGCFGENRGGLGAHVTDIQALLEEVNGLTQEARAPAMKLQVKLRKAAMIRRSHIEQSRYGAVGGGEASASSGGTSRGAGGGLASGGTAGAAQTGASAGGAASGGTAGTAQTGTSAGGGDRGNGAQAPASGEANGGNSGGSSALGLAAALQAAGVAYRAVEPFGRPRTSGAIVLGISGGDMTKGSCSSLALAYAGCRAGYDVRDFRGGASQGAFSLRSTIGRIARLPGVISERITGINDFAGANKLLEGVAPGKEYYLAAGRHAAIVRRSGDGYEYLELQHPGAENGWHKLTQDKLATRFGCLERCEQDVESFLIDVESLTKSREFLGLLGFINTAEADQKKGVTGHVL